MQPYTSPMLIDTCTLLKRICQKTVNTVGLKNYVVMECE